jgi:hypothetical protein
VSVESPIPSLSCTRCSPHPPFARLLGLAEHPVHWSARAPRRDRDAIVLDRAWIDGKRRIFIQEAGALIFARVRAGIAGFEGKFVEAHALDDKTARKVPKATIGRVLSGGDVRALLDRLSRNAVKAPIRPGWSDPALSPAVAGNGLPRANSALC